MARLFFDLVSLSPKSGLTLHLFLELGELYKPTEPETIYLYDTLFEVPGREATVGHPYSTAALPTGYPNFPGDGVHPYYGPHPGQGFTDMSGLCAALSSHNEMMCVGAAQTRLNMGEDPVTTGLNYIRAGESVHATTKVFDATGNLLQTLTTELAVPDYPISGALKGYRAAEMPPAERFLEIGQRGISEGNRVLYTQRGVLPIDWNASMFLTSPPQADLLPYAGPAVHNLSKARIRAAIQPFFDRFGDTAAIRSWRSTNGDIRQPAGYSPANLAQQNDNGNCTFFFYPEYATTPPDMSHIPVVVANHIQGSWIGYGYTATSPQIAPVSRGAGIAPPVPYLRWNNGNAVEWITGTNPATATTNSTLSLAILFRSLDYGATAKRWVVPGVYEAFTAVFDKNRVIFLGWKGRDRPFVSATFNDTTNPIPFGDWYVRVAVQKGEGRYEWGPEKKVTVPDALIPASALQGDKTPAYEPIIGLIKIWMRGDGALCMGFINGSYKNRSNAEDLPGSDNANSLLAVASSVQNDGTITWQSVQRILRRATLPLLTWRGRMLAGGAYTKDAVADGTFNKRFILGQQVAGGKYDNFSSPFTFDATGASMPDNAALFAREDGSLEYYSGGGLNRSNDPKYQAGTSVLGKKGVELPFRCPSLSLSGAGKWTLGSVV